MEQESNNSYVAKKQEREQARQADRDKDISAQNSKSIKQYAIWILIIALIAYGFYLFSKKAVPQSEDFSIGYEIQGREHVAEGQEHDPYNSNPPSSGWHYASPTKGGFYEIPVPDGTAIHNLEHGDIWIAFHPRISDDAKKILNKFEGAYVVISPREENEGDISLVAWGRVDTFNIENGVVDETRINDFIKRYDNRGPEKVRGVQTRP